MDDIVGVNFIIFLAALELVIEFTVDFSFRCKKCHMRFEEKRLSQLLTAPWWHRCEDK